MTAEAFQQEVKKALGDNLGQIADISQKATPQNLRELRLTATGSSNDLPITWVYYLYSNDLGQRYSIVFTFESNLTEKFAEADRTLTASFDLLKTAKPTRAPASTTNTAIHQASR